MSILPPTLKSQSTAPLKHDPQTCGLVPGGCPACKVTPNNFAPPPFDPEAERRLWENHIVNSVTGTVEPMHQDDCDEITREVRRLTLGLERNSRSRRAFAVAFRNLCKVAREALQDE